MRFLRSNFRYMSWLSCAWSLHVLVISCACSLYLCYYASLLCFHTVFPHFSYPFRWSLFFTFGGLVLHLGCASCLLLRIHVLLHFAIVFVYDSIIPQCSVELIHSCVHESCVLASIYDRFFRYLPCVRASRHD